MEYLGDRLSRQEGYAPRKSLLVAADDIIADTWTGEWTDRLSGVAMTGCGIEVLRLRAGKVSELDAAFVTWPVANDPHSK
jgi:hypothetical protein